NGITNKTQVIKSTDSNLSLTFPASWSKQDMNDQATIQMALPSKEQYLMVIEESASDFASDFTLADYTSSVLTSMSAKLTGPNAPAINDAAVGGGSPAKQFELTGTLQQINLKYLVTCVELDGIFYQLIAWSTASKYDAARPAFDTILASLTF
ncbi:MAG: hypothetical protein FWF49_01385, partial [Oscillospiraceae bacterium]|nr:hypothetical protein [Oscillospiraceae bacterium]